MSTVLACALAWVLGGIPFGLVLVRLIRGVDIRTIGSGNVGATNAARAFTSRRGRIAAFAAIYILDFAKGFLPTLLFPDLFELPPSAGVAVGAATVLGHCFSPFLRLRGGKGVATGCGVFAALEPLALLVALLGFAAAYALARRVFVGSLTLGVTLALAVVFRDPATAFAERAGHSALALAVAVFLFYTHRSNLAQALGARGSRA